MPIIGIDFGTTKSAVAVWDPRHGSTTVVSDTQGHRYTPSLVMIAPDERVYVGWEAATHPARYQSRHFTIGSIKRQIGKAGETTWGRLRTYPQEIAALILGQLRIQTEAYLGCEVSEAVITAPAHFDVNQRWATIDAAEIAGLRTLRLLNEPTAALLAHRFRRRGEEGLALVFDFGGGSLDVSVVEFGEGTYQVKSVSGDDRLGGDDFDQAIVEYVLDFVKRDFGSLSPFDSMQQLVLVDCARRAKEELSSAPSSRIYLPAFLTGQSRRQDLDVSLDRNTFESLCGPLFRRAATVVGQALDDAGISGAHLHEVLLMGGTSHIPRVQQIVKEVIGPLPRTKLDPGFCVAEGAAIQAAVLNGEVRDVLLLDVEASTYSIAVKGGTTSPMIRRNTTIPTLRSSVFSTTEDNQDEVIVRIYQGETGDVTQDAFVGAVRLTGLVPAPAGVPEVEVTFDIDANGVFTVTAKDKATWRRVETILQAPYRLNAAQQKVLKRKVGETLRAAREREWRQAESEREAMAQNKVRTLIAKLEALLESHSRSPDSAEASLLVAGKNLLADFIDRNVSRDELEKLASSVRRSYEDAVVVLLERTAREKADSPEFPGWASDAADALQWPSLLDASLQRLRTDFGNATAEIARVLDLEERASQYSIAERSVAELTDNPKAALFLAIILSRFFGLHSLWPHINTDPRSESHQPQLLQVLIFTDLRRANPPTARRAAAEAVFHLFRGTECFFLMHYLVDEVDPQVTAWLDKAIADIPAGSWHRRYLGAGLEERANLVRHPIASRELRRDVIRVLHDVEPDGQLGALGVLKLVGIEGHIATLVSLLGRELSVEAKVDLIRLLAASHDDQVIPPLLGALSQESARVRRAAEEGLSGCLDLMDRDVRRFFELAVRVFTEGQKLTLRDRLFLRGLPKKHAELRELISSLSRARPWNNKASRARPRDD